MADLCNPAAVRRLLEEHGLAPKKSFGQNFLVNPLIPERIAEASAAAGSCECALEIGPGVGALTRELAARYRKVSAVEIDRGLIPVLAETLADCPNVHVIEGDFMKTDVLSLLRDEFGGAPADVCGNLPYYITTPILMRLLEISPPDGAPLFRRITLMVQSEVADRICAGVGDRDCGALTIAVALRGTAVRRFGVPAGNFLPAPKVSSAVLTIDLHPHGVRDVFPDAPAGEAFAPFFRKVTSLVDAAYGQRRKTLTNALSGVAARASVERALEQMGLRPDVRGEKLGAADFCRLALILTEKEDR